MANQRQSTGTTTTSSKTSAVTATTSKQIRATATALLLKINENKLLGLSYQAHLDVSGDGAAYQVQLLYLQSWDRVSKSDGVQIKVDAGIQTMSYCSDEFSAWQIQMQ